MAGLAPVEVACVLGLRVPGAREGSSLLCTLEASPRLRESRQQLRATRVTLEGREPRSPQRQDAGQHPHCLGLGWASPRSPR